MSRIERATRKRICTTDDCPPGPTAGGEPRQRTRQKLGTRSRGQGQSLVEFAVVLPVFLLLLAGIVDFGMGLYSQMTIINASREGARIGVVEPGNVPAIEDRVKGMASGLDVTVEVTCLRPSGGSSFSTCPNDATKWQSGDAVRVKVDYQYRMLWPLALGNKIDLSSTTQMRIE